MDSDWDNDRVTLGRSFVRDMEGLWSEVLKLAAVVEDALDQSIHALCDGRGELADELKQRKGRSTAGRSRSNGNAFAYLPCTSRSPLTCGVSPPSSKSTEISSGFAIWPAISPSA